MGGDVGEMRREARGEKVEAVRVKKEEKVGRVRDGEIKGSWWRYGKEMEMSGVVL